MKIKLLNWDPAIRRIVFATVLMLALGLNVGGAILRVAVSKDVPNLGVINGVVNCDIGQTWNGCLPLDVVQGIYSWRITGSSFGAQKGTVAVLGRQVPVISWSNTEILIDPAGQIGPVCGYVKVTPKVGIAQQVTLNMVPSCWGTIYSQCTWYVSYQRWLHNLSPASYFGANSLNGNWTPQPLDYLIFGTSSGNNKHVALVVASSRAKDGTYTLTLSDYNADGRNSGPRSYTSTFNPSKGVIPWASKSMFATGWKR